MAVDVLPSELDGDLIVGPGRGANLVVDVPHRVEAEAVDSEVGDPGLVDVDQAVDRAGCSVNRSSRPKKSP
jgi:hypothetical protein